MKNSIEFEMELAILIEQANIMDMVIQLMDRGERVPEFDFLTDLLTLAH